MSFDLALYHILFSKVACARVTKALILSFVILIASDSMMRENTAALLSSDSARVNSPYKLQTQSQMVLQNVSPFASILLPENFAFSYSFGIIGETNNTISSNGNIYIKENEGARPTSITFALSEAEMQRIWTTAIETGFFQIKNNFTDNCDKSGNCVLVAPEHYYILRITGDNDTQTVVARDGYAFPQDDEYQKFKSLVNEIDKKISTILPEQYGNNTMPSNNREPERGFL
jgi:hypothetical protein